MIDTHIHIERGPYTIEWVNQFVRHAMESGMREIYLLEHSHRFEEFSPMYESVCRYNEYQKLWYSQRRGLSIKQYENFIKEMRTREFPVEIKWGLEICYFPAHEQLISNALNGFNYDFATGSIHWIDDFGFDHKAELWEGMDAGKLYNRYYELMLQLIKSGLFTGLAHPDSIKCFGCLPVNDLSEIYNILARELNLHKMYAEQSGGLAHNYGFCEKGMNRKMLDVFKANGVDIRCASDAHKPEDVGANIKEMLAFLA